MPRILLPLFLGLVLSLFFWRNDLQAEWKRRELASSPATNELSSPGYMERILLSNGQLDPNPQKAVWFNHQVPLPNLELAQKLLNQPKTILGVSTEERWIEVDLTTQTLYAHEGSQVVYSFKISSGLPWLPTQTGEFHIWSKLLSQRMTGGSVADGTYYDLPNVQFVQYFNMGYGLHAAYWHHAFGYPRSHGCVNMRPEDARVLFYWTNPTLPDGQSALYNISPDQGTRVVVHGSTPTDLHWEIK